MNLRRRLGLARIYWQHCATFHFAHKPLCAQYSPDLLRIRGFWLCRSCTWLWLGLLCGALAWVWLPMLTKSQLLTGYLVALGSTILFSVPLVYKRWPRVVRDLLRFSAGLCIAIAPYIALKVNLAAGLASIAAIVLFRHFYLRSHLRRQLSECRTCPARNAEVVCDGFSRQTQLLSRYQHAATEYLYASGYVPRLP